MTNPPLNADQPLLAMPEGLTAQGKKAYKVVMEFLKRYEFDGVGIDPGGCKTFYSPKEWLARGEKYGKGSALVIVFDGGDVYNLISYTSENYKAQERLTEMLAKEGFYYENMNSWSAAVYKI
jgi:hypothetical protein